MTRTTQGFKDAKKRDSTLNTPIIQIMTFVHFSLTVERIYPSMITSEAI